MRNKPEFLQILKTTLMVPIVVSSLVALIVEFDLFYEPILTEFFMFVLIFSFAVFLGNLLALPFLLFIYLPCIYLVTRRIFNLFVFILVGTITSGVAGIFISYQFISDPMPITEIVSLPIFRCSVITGFFSAIIQYKILLKWSLNYQKSPEPTSKPSSEKTWDE